MTIETGLAVVGIAVGALAWLFRLEGRVNGHDSTIGNMREDVKYIRDRVDRAINGKYGE